MEAEEEEAEEAEEAEEEEVVVVVKGEEAWVDLSRLLRHRSLTAAWLAERLERLQKGYERRPTLDGRIHRPALPLQSGSGDWGQASP